MKNTGFRFIVMLLSALPLLYSCNSEALQEEGPDFSGALTQEAIDGGVMTPEILWKFGRVGDHRLSPDGRVVVYTVTRYDAVTQERVTDLYTVTSEGTDLLKLTGSDEAHFNPRWKPGSDMIGYLSDASGEVQLWEMDVNGAVKTQVSEVEGGISGFEYSPDGSRVLYLKEVKFRETTAEL
jgi:Tol biopolymer transport system component